MKFYVHRTHTIMDGLVVRWNPARNLDAEISASRNGVAISGHWMLTSPESIEMFRKVLDRAYELRGVIGRREPLPRFENEIDFHFGDSLEDAVRKHEETQACG